MENKSMLFIFEPLAFVIIELGNVKEFTMNHSVFTEWFAMDNGDGQAGKGFYVRCCCEC